MVDCNSMFATLKHTIVHNLYSIPGWHTRRRIIVLESDDWGTIRMPNRRIYDLCLKAGYRVDKHPYEHYDSLATADDLSALFDVLMRFRDSNGRYPVITANTVLANPDFEKIEADQFRNYYYELFTRTLERYYPNENTFKMWRQGIDNGIFHPQFHGREHFNIPEWLDRLARKDTDALFGFQHGMVGITPKHEGRKNALMIGLRPKSESQYNFQLSSLTDGLVLFEKIFGYKSLSFIAPSYTWPLEIEPILYKNNVKYIQGAAVHCAPDRFWQIRKIRHYIGEKNRSGQYYIIRNCIFEPSQMEYRDRAVSECLSQIANAFIWRKPAIISTHRLNYIGRIEESNRKENLDLLDNLLTNILQRWPDVEFMTSEELGQLIES